MAKQNVTVELFYNGAWNTAPVYVRNGVTITRGRADETGQPTPQTLTLTLDNRSGDYNPRNATSPLYGLVGRNTPIRVSVDGRVRFYGEVASWKPGRTVDFNPDTGKGDAWTQVEAAGILRRLGQGNKPGDSALTRAYATADPQPIAWWPLEDGRSVDRAASGIPGQPPIVELGREPGVTQIGTGNHSGLIVWGVQGSEGAASLAGLQQGGRLSGKIPTSTAASWTFEFVIRYDAGSNPTNAISLPMTLWAGDMWEWSLLFDPLGTVTLAAGSVDGSIVGVSESGPFPGWDGRLHLIRLDVEQAGGNSAHFLRVDGELVASGTWSSFLAPVPDKVLPNYYLDSGDNAPSIGHLALFAPNAPLTDSTRPAAAHGWVGETAADRVERLCAEQGVTSSVTGSTGSQPMGPQKPGKFLDLLADCEDTDGGLLGEPRDQLGLTFRGIGDLYNQPPIELDFTQLAPPLEPVNDDDQVRNDVTVSRPDSGSARSTQTTGPLSVLDPPDGVGVYDTQETVNVESDIQLPDQAGWRRHKGTVDETRFPRVIVDLVAHPEIAADAEAVDIGDRITVANLPADMGADAADLLVLGYTEQVGSHTRTITFNAAPASPYTVATAGGDPQVAADGSTVAVDAAAAATTLLLASTAANGPWTTDGVPLNVRVGGEQVTASAIGPALSDTFTRSVSGGWGTTDGGAWPWTTFEGFGSNYLVDGARGVHSMSARNSTYITVAGPLVVDVDFLTTIRIGVLATGAPITGGSVARFVSSSDNHYVLRAEFRTDQSLLLTLFRFRDGSFTALKSGSVTRTFHSTGALYTLRTQLDGPTIRARLWHIPDPEPAEWDIDYTDSDPVLTPGRVGARSFLSSSNTNALPVTVEYDDITMLTPQAVTLSAGLARAWPAGTGVDVWQPAVAAL